MDFESAIARTAGRLASALGPRSMRRLARLNRYVTNPVMRRIAPRSRHLAMIEHTGRRSGTVYRTPVMAFVDDGGTLTVVLNYGVNSDWVRNVTSGTPTTVVHRCRRFKLTSPRIVRLSTAADLPTAARQTRTAADSALQAELALA